MLEVLANRTKLFGRGFPTIFHMGCFRSFDFVDAAGELFLGLCDLGTTPDVLRA